MSTFTFKTSLKCEGCVAKITEALNKEGTISSWKVDLSKTEKDLEIESPGLKPERIIEILQSLGYRSELKLVS